MESLELNHFWEQVKAELINVLPENAHPWVYPLEVSAYDKGVLTLVTGQIMGRDLLRRNHYSQIVEVLKKISKNENSDIEIIYDASAAKSLKKESEKIQKKVAEASLKEQAMENLSYMQSASNLNLKYKFENFVVDCTLLFTVFHQFFAYIKIKQRLAAEEIYFNMLTMFGRFD